MSPRNTSDRRRKILKSVVAGSGAVIAGKSLPENWSKPIVNSVLLPAHASTSAANYSGSASAQNDYGDESLFQICIQCNGSDCSAQVLENFPDGNVYFYQGSGSANSSLMLTQPTNCDGYTVNLSIDSVNGVATGNLTLLDGDDILVLSTGFNIDQQECSISVADANCIEEAEAKSENGGSSRRGH